MKHFRLLTLCLLLLSPGSAALAAPANVLLFSIDSCRPDRFGCNGYMAETTPHIDRWSRSGTVFKQAYSTSAWTAPGLVSILTGLPPSVHGVDNRDRTGSPQLVTLQKLLKNRGYRVPNLNFFTFAPYYTNLGLEPVDRSYFGDEDGAAMLNWLRRNPFDPESPPFFLWFHSTFVHQPYRPPPESLPAAREELEKSEGIRAVMNGAIIPWGSTTFRPEDEAVLDQLYDAEVRRTDAFFGKVLALLEEKGLLDTTLIIVTADHGEELLEHGFVGHASTSLRAKLFEELVRIPLIVSFPNRVPSGAIVSHPVSQIDILPTVLRLLKLDQGQPSLPGRDLFDPPVERSLCFESVIAGNQTPRDRENEWVRAIRKGRWKLIQPGGLFDLLTDPGETIDLSSDQPELLGLLRKGLEDCLSREGRLPEAPLLPVDSQGDAKRCPRIYTPGNGETLRYEIHTGALLFDWSGDMGTAYLIEYDIGTGDHHVAGTYEVLGNHQILGPFPRELWVDLKAWNPFRIRVSPKQEAACWSDWVEFRF